MGQITITKKDGTTVNLFSKEPFTSVGTATQEKELMSNDTVKLDIKSAQVIKFQIGDKISVDGYDYKIRNANASEIIADENYNYNVTFYGSLYDLMKTIYRDCSANGNSKTAIFDLTYTLREFVNVIIYNLNRDYSGIWAFDADNCPETEAQTISFSKQNCLNVLQSLCNKFGYEFLIVESNGVRTIKIGKFGAVIKPPTGADYFEVGKGMGLYTLKEDKIDDKSIITRLWVEGGSTNIPSGYRSYAERLQLPLKRLNKHAHTLSDGTSVSEGSETIGIDDDSHRYFEDSSLKDNIGSIEDIDQTDDIYPKRTGKVTALGSDVYTFVDDTMDFDLNGVDSSGNTLYLITDTTAKITFTSGKLAGQQFELKKVGGYNNDTKTFSLIKYTDSRGMSFPSESNEAFRFAVGDTYKLTDIVLPQSYIDDAEEDLWYYGLRKFNDAKQARVQYTLTFTRDFFVNNLPTDSEESYFHVGDYIPIRDTRFGIEKNVRITKISRNLLLDHDYTLTISDAYTLNIISQVVQEVMNHETIINQSGVKDLNKARRGWRTTEDLRNLVFDTDGYFDMEHMKANIIDTNMLTVGVKSQQFVLDGVIFKTNLNGNPNQMEITSGTLYHLTIDDTKIKSWSMASASIQLVDTGGYYVYAKCSRSGDSGIFYVTQEKILCEPTSDPNNYYFLCGIIGVLHSDDNYRDFTTTYGFTRINGNTIVTGKIKGAGSSFVINLDTGKITGYSSFTDKPDLSVYATESELSVQGDRITSTQTQVNNLTGEKMVSMINQTASTITINASKINMQGTVTFSMFTSDVQSIINAKANSSDLGSLATLNSVNYSNLNSALQTTIDSKVAASTLGALAYLSSVSSNNLATSLLNTINAKANTNSLGELAYWNKSDIGLGSLAYLSAVEKSQLGTTIVQNGLIVTSMIDVDNLYATHLHATVGYVGGFTLSSSQLTATAFTLDPSSGIIFGQYSDTQYTAIGKNVIPSSTGTQCNCIIKNASYSGGSATNGSCIYLMVGHSAYSDVPQQWLYLGHTAGWGSTMKIESRYLGESSGAERLCINATFPMNYSNLEAHLKSSSGTAYYPLYWEENTGWICTGKKTGI